MGLVEYQDSYSDDKYIGGSLDIGLCDCYEKKRNHNGHKDHSSFLWAVSSRVILSWQTSRSMRVMAM